MPSALGVASLALVLQLQSPALEQTPARRLVARTRGSEYVDQLWEDGRHVRFGTADRGPVHVWRPRRSHADSAETVVYVHGFYVDVDAAVLEHRLITQLRDSGRNALFVACETRSGPGDPIFWPELEPLLVAVEARTGAKRPSGPVSLVAHSGGYATAASWLSHPAITRVVLVDGLYGSEEPFVRWLDEDASRQLVLVGFDTQPKAAALAQGREDAVRIDDVPYLFDPLPPEAARARLLSLQSERFDHMELVTSGRFLPWLLRVLPRAPAPRP